MEGLGCVQYRGKDVYIGGIMKSIVRGLSCVQCRCCVVYMGGIRMCIVE